MGTGMRPFEIDELAPLRREIARGPLGLRNRALLECGLFTGFRISELLSLDVADVLKGGRIAETVTVKARAMKRKLHSRKVVLSAPVKEALRSWLAERERRGTLLLDRPLFDTFTGRRLRRQAAWEAIAAACERAGLGRRGHGTHGMRKTFAVGVHAFFMRRLRRADGGRAIDVLQGVQHALGHQSIDSTVRYLSVVEQSDIDEAILSLTDR